MSTVLKVRLTPAVPPGSAAPPLLCAAGPHVVLGTCADEAVLARPVVPSPTSLFGPRGACLVSPDGPLWVADSGHHRLLGWRRRPQADGTPADWVIGQPDFGCEGRNAKGAVGAESLNVPTGVCACGDGLAVADAWNHRVLLWHRVPQDAHVPADRVLGQADFSGGEANRGGAPRADTLFWPYGVLWDGVRLWVADTGNRRVLMWHGLPRQHGAPADRVLGQADFTRRDENGGAAPDAASMRWPHALAAWREGLAVADAGNNRIMVWRHLPAHDNQPCDVVLGQADARQVEHNRARYWPDAACLNMPYGVAAAGSGPAGSGPNARLLVADTANSRLLGWDADADHDGAPASRLTGQPGFGAKGDNRWQLPVRDSLCWPYAVSVCGGCAVIADSGNNRVVLWTLAEEGP